MTDMVPEVDSHAALVDPVKGVDQAGDPDKDAGHKDDPREQDAGHAVRQEEC